MNILICVNKMYLDKAKTMLYSLKERNPEHHTIFLMTHSLSNVDIDRFGSYLEQKLDCSLKVIDVNGAGFDDMPTGTRHFSLEMYFRILAQFLLPQELDRVLWLDADIILMKSLRNFYEQDFEGNFYVACPDAGYESEEIRAIKENIGLPKEHIYFNSGVLLLNLSMLRKQTNREHILKTAEKLAPKLEYPDQDILNYLYTGKIKYADWKQYNFQVLRLKKVPAEVLEKVVVLHYAGKWKPWNFRTMGPISRPYWRIVCKQGGYMRCAESYIKYFLFSVKHMMLDWRNAS